MPSFLESCENYYGTRDLYRLLQVEKKATEDEIKKAYRKLSLLVHPDRVSDEDKENATEKFKVLGKVYSVLSDTDKRSIYDETGSVDDEDGDLDKDWTEYWRSLFKEITFEDIIEYEKAYKNSSEEVGDLIKAYNNGRGSMDYIFDHVPFSNPSEEDRLREVLQGLIDKGEIKPFKAFTHERPEKREARKRKWAKEAVLAEKAKEDLNTKKANKKKSEETPDEGGLLMAIMARKKQREADADALFKRLEEKYCKPQGKGRKAKK